MRFAASQSWREFVRGLRASPLYFWRFAGPLPERLLIAPTDLHTADPTVAHDIYSGMFVFAGQSVDGFGESPFQLEPPTLQWARELHGFTWLRHLRASDMALSRANARAMVDDWIRLERHHFPQAFEPEITARRIIAWLGPCIGQSAFEVGPEVRRAMHGFRDEYGNLREAFRLAMSSDSLDIAAEISVTTSDFANRGRMRRRVWSSSGSSSPLRRRRCRWPSMGAVADMGRAGWSRN